MPKTKEKTIAELLCNPSIEIEVYENAKFDSLHEFVYRQVDFVSLIAAFNSILLKQEWLTDERDGYLPTTSRKYSSGYLKDVKIKEVKHGSLFLSILGSVASGLILMLIQETYKRMHPGETNPPININVNFDRCNIIALNGNQVYGLPDNSVVKKALKVDTNTGINGLDSKALIEGILEKIDIGDDLEVNIHRCIDVLHDEKIIRVSPAYNSKGIRTIENCAGRFIDFSV